MIKKIYLCVFFHFVFSIEIYKEIKIFNEEIENISFLQSLGLDVDHMIHRVKITFNLQLMSMI